VQAKISHDRDLKVLKQFVAEKFDSLYAQTRTDLSTSINLAFDPIKEIEVRIQALEAKTVVQTVVMQEQKVSVDNVSSTLSAI